MPEPSLVDDAPERASRGSGADQAVSLRGITKRFGDVTAVAGVNLDIGLGRS